jgi:hypothetical protein
VKVRCQRKGNQESNDEPAIVKPDRNSTDAPEFDLGTQEAALTSAYWMRNRLCLVQDNFEQQLTRFFLRGALTNPNLKSTPRPMPGNCTSAPCWNNAIYCSLTF